MDESTRRVLHSSESAEWSTPILVVDLDGVCVEFCHGFTTVAHRQGRVSQPWYTHQQPEWHFDFHVDPVWEEVDSSPTFWLDLTPLASGHDIAALNWAAERSEIMYVTGRQGPQAWRQTPLWLHDHGFPPGEVFYVKGSKLPLLRQYRERIVGVIEDKPDTILELRAAGIPATVRRWKYNDYLAGPSTESIAAFVHEALT